MPATALRDAPGLLAHDPRDAVATTIEALARHLHAIDQALGDATGAWQAKAWWALDAGTRATLTQDAKDFVAAGDYILGHGWKSEDVDTA